MKRNYFNGLLAALTLFGLGTSQAWADKIVTSTAENPKWFRIYTPNRSNLSHIEGRRGGHAEHQNIRKTLLGQPIVAP